MKLEAKRGLINEYCRRAKTGSKKNNRRTIKRVTQRKIANNPNVAPLVTVIFFLTIENSFK